MVALPETLSITASDPAGQRTVTVSAPGDTSIGELVDQIRDTLNLGRVDRAGKPMAVQALLQRESRHLARSERTADALRPGDHVVLHPRVMAGGMPD